MNYDPRWRTPRVHIDPRTVRCDCPVCEEPTVWFSYWFFPDSAEGPAEMDMECQQECSCHWPTDNTGWCDIECDLSEYHFEALCEVSEIESKGSYQI